jgi:hypothetical protein
MVELFASRYVISFAVAMQTGCVDWQQLVQVPVLFLRLPSCRSILSTLLRMNTVQASGLASQCSQQTAQLVLLSLPVPTFCHLFAPAWHARYAPLPV